MNRKPGRPKAPSRPSPISWRPETAEQAAAFKALGGGRWLRQVLDGRPVLDLIGVIAILERLLEQANDCEEGASAIEALSWALDEIRDLKSTG